MFRPGTETVLARRQRLGHRHRCTEGCVRHNRALRGPYWSELRHIPTFAADLDDKVLEGCEGVATAVQGSTSFPRACES